jgi:transposase
MQPMYYIGLDVHKKKISYCVKDGGGQVYREGQVPATRLEFDLWMKTLPQPWMEATIFTGWIYDHLKPHAVAVKVAHPLMLRAIAAAKKKNDRIDANKICDCLRFVLTVCALYWMWRNGCEYSPSLEFGSYAGQPGTGHGGK